MKSSLSSTFGYLFNYWSSLSPCRWRVTATLLLIGQLVATGASINIMTNGTSFGSAANWSLASAPVGSANPGSYTDLIFNPAATALTNSSVHIYSESLNVTNGSAYTLSANAAAGIDIRIGNNNSTTDTTFVNPLSGAGQDLIFLTNNSSLTLNPGNVGGGTPMTLVVRQGGNLNVSSGATLTINAAITGSSAITNTGTGVTTLGGTNANTGVTAVTAGTVNLTGSLNGSTVVITNALFSESTTGTIAGASSGITVNGGTATLKGTNTYGGATTVLGTVQVFGAPSLSGSSTLKTGGSISQKGSVVLASADSGYAMNQLSDGGFIAISNASSGAATLTFTNGAVITGTTGKELDVNTNTTVVVNGSLFDLVGTQGVNNRVLVLGVDGTLTINAPVQDKSSLGTNSGMIKSGQGIVYLNGTNSYTGPTTISAGTLQVAGPGALGGGTLLSGASLSDSTLLNLATAGAYGVSNLSLGGILRVASLSGSATLTFSNASVLTGTGTKTVDAGTNVVIYFNNNVDLFGTQSPTNRNLNVQDAGTVVFNASITNTDTSGTYLGGLHVLGTGTTILNAANSYNGDTTVSGGALVLGAGGSIANSTNIIVASSATLDVSAAGFTLGSARSLANTTNNATAATLNGNLNASVGTTTLFYTNGVPAFNVTNGTLTLASTTVLNLTNTGSSLPAGNYKLISKAANDVTGVVAATLPAVIVGGGGASAAATLSVTGGELYLHVAASLPATGTNITFNVSGTALTLNWPASYLGWELQSNSASLTSSNSWFLVPNSTSTNQVSIAVDPTQANVFYRMHHP